MSSLNFGHLSIWHCLILGAVILLVFECRIMISDMMGDFAHWIRGR